MAIAPASVNHRIVVLRCRRGEISDRIVIMVKPSGPRFRLRLYGQWRASLARRASDTRQFGGLMGAPRLVRSTAPIRIQSYATVLARIPNHNGHRLTVSLRRVSHD